MAEQPFVLRVRLKSVRELEAELADLTERLSRIHSIASHPSSYEGASKALGLIKQTSSLKS